MVPTSRIRASVHEADRQRTEPVPLEATVTRDDVERVARKMKNTNDATLRRSHTLRLVMAALEGLTFEEAAVLVGERPERIAAWLQDQPIPRSKQQRLEDLYSITRHLQVLVPRGNTGRWFRLPIPALGGATPFDAVVSGRIDEVAQLTHDYVDPSYV